MTDEPTANDRIDRPTDDTTGTDQSGSAEDGTPGKRSLLKAAGAALAGATGLGVLGGTASAASNTKHVVVVGYGTGHHTYEIEMESGGQIRKAPMADRSDSTGTNAYGNQRVQGELWHWNADSFAYTGEISSVRGDGNLSFHFEDGALETESLVYVEGQESGQSRYSITTPRGDVDTGYFSENPDSDDGIGYADGERYWTQDRVSGVVEKGRWDSYDLRNDTAIQTMTVSEGSVTFS